MIRRLHVANLKRTRYISEQVWNTVPESLALATAYNSGMHVMEIIRHIIDADAWFYNLTIHHGDVSKIKPTNGKVVYESIRQEIVKGKDSLLPMLQLINTTSNDDYEQVIINRTDKKFTMNLNNFLTRICYHEAYHTGQLVALLRDNNIEVPTIWNVDDGFAVL